MPKRPKIAVCLVLAVIVVAVVSTVWRSRDVPSGVVGPVAERGAEYTTSTGCRECHAEEYDSWHDSFHRTMTQEANAESVVAPIDDVTLTSRGRSYRFYQKGDEFRVRMVDPAWESQRKLRGLPIEGFRNHPVIDQQIVMTTGSHHHQAYWIKGAGNEFRQVPFVYHIATKQWIPNEDSFLQPGSHERQSQRWNDNCIICHTVGGRPGLELVANADNQRVGRFNSSFVELGIACEACHGPGALERSFRELRVQIAIRRLSTPPDWTRAAPRLFAANAMPTFFRKIRSRGTNTGTPSHFARANFSMNPA